jgi:hypothetical protein
MREDVFVTRAGLRRPRLHARFWLARRLLSGSSMIPRRFAPALLMTLALWLAALPAWAAPPRWQSSPPKPEQEADESDKKRDGCRDSVTSSPELEMVLRGLVFQLGDEKKSLAGMRLTGLQTVKEAALWEIIGGQPASWDAARAALTLRRLVGLGIFAEVTPVLEISPTPGPTLVVNLVEHPTVRKVVFEGLSEIEPEGLLEELLESPSREDVQRRRVRDRSEVSDVVDAEAKDDAEVKDEDDQKLDNLTRGPRQALRKLQRLFDERGYRDGRCPDPLPPRDWLGRAEGETVFPGVVWKGLAGALDRVQHRMYDRGYQLSRLSAELASDGTLTVRIDEGKITRLEIRGVAPRLEPQVRTLLGIQPGESFVESDLDDSLDRIEHEFPFLRPHRQELPSRAEPAVEEVVSADGTRRYQSQEKPASSEHRWFTVADGTVVVHLRARRVDSDTSLRETIRHTPVTSFAPGLETTGRLWDPENRAHLVVDLAGNINTHRATQAPPGSERWRFDGRVGPRVQIPDLKVAELGVQGYSVVDTADRWRMGAIDSYIYSLLLNRPDSHYFRREGLTAFLTFHLFQRLTAGVEYRRDQYQSLVSAPDVFTIFRRAETAPITPAITDGRMGSVLVRLEYSTHPVPLHEVGDSRRDPERSIMGDDGDYFWTELRTVNTVEIADPDLGGDALYQFVRLVSDTAVFLRTSGSSGIKLRARAAGRLGDGDLPLQKAESLGGWSALRGYGFKEFVGDFSLLGTAEYRLGGLSLFVDTGSVRSAGAFSAVRTGLGASLNFGDEARLDVAWRADGEARLRPELRLLFERTF